MPNVNQPHGRQFIRTRAAFKKLAVSNATGWRMIRDGRLPKPIVVSEKIRVFDVADLDRLMDEYAAQGDDT
jgi:predicted DNA-binding transcriptional regulator AlpA